MDIWRFNLRHLRALAMTVELGGVNAAARAISLSQPAVTQAIARLEDELGVTLFERRPEGMKSLPAATVFAARIKPALALVGSTRATATQARSFLAVARTSSYVSASVETGLTQPSLHRAVGDLEIALGYKLVERRGRGLMLTKRGEQTARRFRLAQRELEAGLSELAALQGREEGRITIGAMPLSRARLLPRAILAFQELHPDIELSVVEGAHADLIEPLRDGELDFMLGALRDPSPGPDIDQRALFDDAPAVFGRKQHPLYRPHAAPPTPEELSQYHWLIADKGAPLRQMWSRIFTDAGLEPPHVAVSSGSAILIRQILRRSNHLSLLSTAQVQMELDAGGLVRICDAPPWLTRRIGVTTRKDWRPTVFQADMLAELNRVGELEN